MWCGNTAYRVKCDSNKIESVGLGKCLHCHYLTKKVTSQNKHFAELEKQPV